MSPSSSLQARTVQTPYLLLFPKSLSPGSPMVLSPTEPPFTLHTAGLLVQKHHLLIEVFLILFRIANLYHFPLSVSALVFSVAPII